MIIIIAKRISDKINFLLYKYIIKNVKNVLNLSKLFEIFDFNIMTYEMIISILLPK